MQADRDCKPLDLTGRWQVIHHVAASARLDFIGLDIAFQIRFSQDGQQLAGEGEKFLVDRMPARPDEVSRLTITGWVQNDDVTISLMEISPRGPERTIIGEIVWKAIDADQMLGQFRVDLADTTGLSEAVRQAAF